MNEVVLRSSEVSNETVATTELPGIDALADHPKYRKRH